ncbi:restriction endonuclease subunit S [Flavihumibacter rivuli]|uniref:restriction endonuclease subunit S n=1 Tax=Flavihumibacter rivuli TaxID=2838156 RepID=UPI001BDEA678|nr:restriction endonuclease subunit S [Flavihumibacter rivuli]ULQ55061.1 restriction endonuclease subunit S [Flavihumibacter rivuli]
MSRKRKNKISECCDILDNLRVPINDEIRQTMQGNIPYYGANGIQGYIDKYIFDEDLILLAEDGGNFEEYHTRPIAYKISGKSWVNNHAHILRAKQEFNQDYIFYSLVHKDITKYLNSGTRSKLNKSELEKIEIDFPATKDEENKIAKILSTADAVIEKTQAAIAKYKAIKQGMLQDLFTRGIDLKTNKLRPRYEDAPELYKESKLRMIPKEWDEKELGDVGEVRMCRRVFNYETSDQGDIPFYKIGTFGKQPDAYISKELYDSYRQQFSFPNKGDILISAAGTIGRTIIYDGTPAYFQDSNIVWIENNGDLISNEYLYQVFQIVEYKTEGGTIQRLYNSILKSALFPCPCKPEQQLITERLKAIDTKLQTEQTYLQKMQSLKRGLMEDLLSGRKQVPVLS